MDSYFLELDFLERVLRFPFMFNQVVDTSTSSTTTKSDPAGCRNAIDVEFEEVKEEQKMNEQAYELPSEMNANLEIMTKEKPKMIDELCEAMERAAEEQVVEEQKDNKFKTYKKNKKNRNIVNPEDIVAIRIFRSEDYDETKKIMADLRLYDGRIKRICWAEDEVDVKHIITGWTIIFDERPKIKWEDLLK